MLGRLLLPPRAGVSVRLVPAVWGSRGLASQPVWADPRPDGARVWGRARSSPVAALSSPVAALSAPLGSLRAPRVGVGLAQCRCGVLLTPTLSSPGTGSPPGGPKVAGRDRAGSPSAVPLPRDVCLAWRPRVSAATACPVLGSHRAGPAPWGGHCLSQLTDPRGVPAHRASRHRLKTQWLPRSSVRRSQPSAPALTPGRVGIGTAGGWREEATGCGLRFTREMSFPVCRGASAPLCLQLGPCPATAPPEPASLGDG